MKIYFIEALETQLPRECDRLCLDPEIFLGWLRNWDFEIFLETPKYSEEEIESCQQLAASGYEKNSPPMTPEIADVASNPVWALLCHMGFAQRCEEGYFRVMEKIIWNVACQSPAGGRTKSGRILNLMATLFGIIIEFYTNHGVHYYFPEDLGYNFITGESEKVVNPNTGNIEADIFSDVIHYLSTSYDDSRHTVETYQMIVSRDRSYHNMPERKIRELCEKTRGLSLGIIGPRGAKRSDVLSWCRQLNEKFMEGDI